MLSSSTKTSVGEKPVKNLVLKITHEPNKIKKPKIYTDEIDALEVLKKGGASVFNPLYFEPGQYKGFYGLLHEVVLEKDEETALEFFKYLFQEKLIKPEALEIKTGLEQDGETILHIAARQGHLGLIQFLLNKNPKLYSVLDSKGGTALFDAINYTHSDVIDYFLGLKGININLQDEEGMTPLCYACSLVEEEGDFHLSTVASLIRKGASLEIVDNEGKKPFDYLTLDQQEKLEPYIHKSIIPRPLNDLYSSFFTRFTIELSAPRAYEFLSCLTLNYLDMTIGFVFAKNGLGVVVPMEVLNLIHPENSKIIRDQVDGLIEPKTHQSALTQALRGDTITI